MHGMFNWSWQKHIFIHQSVFHSLLNNNNQEKELIENYTHTNTKSKSVGYWQTQLQSSDSLNDRLWPCANYN